MRPFPVRDEAWKTGKVRNHMNVAIVVSLFLHYTAAMAIFGASAFRSLMSSAEAHAIDGPLRRILAAVAVVLAINALVMLLSEASAMGGAWAAAVDPKIVGQVLLNTGFGTVWRWHLGLVVITGIAFVTAPMDRPWTTIVAGALLASLAFIGHAAMIDGLVGDVRRLNHAIHLLAAGAWLGGLIPLGLTLTKSRFQSATAAITLRRFSLYGTVAVALILTTGVVNTAVLVGGAKGLVPSPYLWTLSAKIGLVVAMISFAFVNRFYLTPTLGSDAAKIAGRLRRSIALELVVGLAIILIASLLGTLAPPSGS